MVDKQTLRREIAARKKLHSAESLNEWSQMIRRRIESLELFQRARSILLYHSLPDEVQTHSMLSGWQGVKQCYLPQVTDSGLVVRRYEGEKSLKKGQLNIWEPTGAICADLGALDWVIVPGVAFDRTGGRLGRGKGHYDRLLPLIPAPATGICFDFQLVDLVPVEAFDVKVQSVLTESFFF